MLRTLYNEEMFCLLIENLLGITTHVLAFKILELFFELGGIWFLDTWANTGESNATLSPKQSSTLNPKTQIKPRSISSKLNPKLLNSFQPQAP